jgi:MtrB/PioB family decaheme-associated outer membrane protein
MKKHLTIILIFGSVVGLVALPAAAQDKPKDDIVVTSRVVVGAENVGQTNRSSKFYEYRDVPDGFFFRAFDLSMTKGNNYFTMNLSRLRQRDARYDLSAGSYGKFKVDFSYDMIPHRYSFEAQSLYTQETTPTGPGVFGGHTFYYGISDQIQSSLQALAPTNPPTTAEYNAARAGLSGYLTGVHSIPLGIQRNKGTLNLEYTPSVPLTLSLDLSRETRKGNRAIGASYGLTNAVEMPEPIDFVTSDVKAKVELDKSWGMVQAGYNVSLFENANGAMIWDNAYRVTDQTYASAYQTGLGTSRGQMALWPSNNAQTLFFNGAVKVLKQTRITGAFSYGVFSQNEELLPYTINSALVASYSGALTAPRATAQAKAHVASFDLSLNSRLFHNNSFSGYLNAGYHSYDFANKTTALEMPGFAVADQIWTAEDHGIEPLSYLRSRAFADVTFSLIENTSLKVGYSRSWMDRQFGPETEGTPEDKSHEDSFKASVDTNPTDWFFARISFLNSQRRRNFDGTEIIYSPDLNFKRYYDANRDRDAVNFLVGFTPVRNLDLELAYGRGKDVYPTSDYGLKDDTFQTYSADVTYALSKKASLYGFYTHELHDANQASRQSGATFSTDPADDWTLLLRDKVDSFGGGFNTVLVKDKLDFYLSYTYSNIKGTADFFSPPGGANLGDAVNFTNNNVDSTKLQILRAQLQYKITRHISAAFTYWYEQYALSDIVRNDYKVDLVVAGYGMYLGALEPGYQYHVGALKFIYSW